jgi:hypothetical protein
MTGDELQAELDDLAALAVRLRTLGVGPGTGAPASGPIWQASAVATDGVHASVDAASQAFANRIDDTANGVSGAAEQLAANEGVSADMVSSVGDVATKPAAEFAGAISKTVGDVTSAFTSSVGDVTGALAAAVASPLAALAGVVDFAALADVSNGDNGGLFDDLFFPDSAGTDGDVGLDTGDADTGDADAIQAI